MDWNAAIEKNREALKRVLVMLVAMAELAGVRPTLPRHLHRLVLRLLRPAEAAVRRLVIVAARGVTVAAVYSSGSRPKHSTDNIPRTYRPPLRVASQTTSPPLDGGEETPVATAGALPLPRRAGERCRPRTCSGGGGVGVEGRPASRCPFPRLPFPLFDPLRRFRPRRPARSGVPRISFPGFSEPFRIPPPPSADDAIDAKRLSLRLAALSRVLDDLPREAKRFARWRCCVAAGAQNKEGRAAGRIRRTWPLRPGRPPGHRTARRSPHEVHEILDVVHGLAFWALESPDTS